MEIDGDKKTHMKFILPMREPDISGLRHRISGPTNRIAGPTIRFPKIDFWKSISVDWFPKTAFWTSISGQGFPKIDF